MSVGVLRNFGNIYFKLLQKFLKNKKISEKTLCQECLLRMNNDAQWREYILLSVVNIEAETD